MLAAADLPTVLESLQACDPSESALSTAPHFLESTFADNLGHSRTGSRAGTPMIVRSPPNAAAASSSSASSSVSQCVPQSLGSPAMSSVLLTPRPRDALPGAYPDSARSSPKSVRLVSETDHNLELKKR